ncbi:hypothetical protein B0H12DRAFT_3836 [Mycena haematopus]|nr:hypothetical protein B0H12DRAFT_3836 [Mycena haematopus]
MQPIPTAISLSDPLPARSPTHPRLVGMPRVLSLFPPRPPLLWPSFSANSTLPGLHDPLGRSYSSSSSSDSSSSHTRDRIPSNISNAGIGRKVAAALQLFKETKEDTSSPASARAGSSKRPDDVAEAKFQFVKRSEWPDREAAAVRRERSMTALRRVRTRESVLLDEADTAPVAKSPAREALIHDLTQWRDNVSSPKSQGSGRGRKRNRPSQSPVFEMDVRLLCIPPVFSVLELVSSFPLPASILRPHLRPDHVRPAYQPCVFRKTRIPEGPHTTQVQLTSFLH